MSTPRKKMYRLAENAMDKKDDPLAFQYRYTVNSLEEWKIVDFRRRGKPRPPNIVRIKPLPLYTSPQKTEKKN